MEAAPKTILTFQEGSVLQSIVQCNTLVFSFGSRISDLGHQTRWGGGVLMSDVGALWRKHAKTKELGPNGGGQAQGGTHPLDSPLVFGCECTAIEATMAG